MTSASLGKGALFRDLLHKRNTLWHVVGERGSQMFSSEVISSFNELESALYRYIMENSEKVVYMRIRDLADAAHISTSSVLRFCRKVNCEGFSEFKLRRQRNSLLMQNMCCLSGQAVRAFWRSMGRGTFQVLRNFHFTSMIRFSRWICSI